MNILRLGTYKQPSGIQITLRKVPMAWAALTDRCVERLVGGEVQEGWYGWEEGTLERVCDGWVQCEERIGSTLA